jgi:predicted nucleic acid-binding protein
MSFLVDTSVWSLAFRRDAEQKQPEVIALRNALEQGENVVCTGLILQELLQGVVGAKSRTTLLDHFSALPMISPTRSDYVDAAALRNHCRRSGVQLGTIDALLAQICISHGLILLSTDADFRHAARFCSLRVWKSP